MLFTDIVASTELLVRLGDEAFDRVRQQHFGALRAAVAAAAGAEVKSLGDGLMVVFPSAADAVGCAECAIQQAAARHNRSSAKKAAAGARRPRRRRAGQEAKTTCSGRRWWWAKRLCDWAAGGQVVVSRLVAEPWAIGAATCSARSGRGLKGLGARSRRVRWCGPRRRRCPAGRACPTQEASGSWAARPSWPRLRGCVAEVQERSRRVVLVAGGAGIGKTTLASQGSRAGAGPRGRWCCSAAGTGRA